MTNPKKYDEEVGSFSIVSCRDRRNPNFQVWGAMSDLGCRKKKIKGFKEWVIERMNEELDSEQNQAIKKLYIIIRNMLNDLRAQMIKSGHKDFDHDLGPGQWVKFCMDFVKKPGCGIEVQIPEEIRRVFPNIRTPFYLRFPYEEEEVGGLSLNPDGTTNELRVNLKHFMSDFEQYKNVLQHELQHIVDKGTSPDYTQNNLLLRYLGYMCHPGEIAAYAKEFARRYYKLFPQDKELDFEKLKSYFFQDQSKFGPTGTILANYIKFGERTEDLVGKYKLDNKTKNELKTCYDSFVFTLKRSFLYFKQTSP